ncbi:hypothetical protein QCA50_012583 [Cerrena zonata]|uniref:Uncharacterized protein n=1 Tax=Cerrena zonata TaxID=2478898 RepID=A0AAW0FYU0_9APHY
MTLTLHQALLVVVQPSTPDPHGHLPFLLRVRQERNVILWHHDIGLLTQESEFPLISWGCIASPISEQVLAASAPKIMINPIIRNYPYTYYVHLVEDSAANGPPLVLVDTAIVLESKYSKSSLPVKQFVK